MSVGTKTGVVGVGVKITTVTIPTSPRRTARNHARKSGRPDHLVMSERDSVEL